MTRLTTTLLFIGWTCTSCLAAETNPPVLPKTAGHRVEQNISKWDANKNGRLDPDEMDAFRRDKIRERQEQLEAKAKAAVETRKMDEALRRTRMVPPALLKQYDTNTNGLIDLDEWKIYRADVQHRLAEKRAARLAAATNAPPNTNTPPK